MQSRDGKVVVITGASRGLGAGMALTMAADGLRLGLCARGMPSPPPEAETLCRAVDVGSAAGVDGFAAAVVREFGSIDLWINNAGVLEPIAPLRECDPADVRAHLEVNILGVFHGSRAFARHRRRLGPGGVLINISSGAAASAYAGWGAYCASKAAVERMTEVLALEEADAGLRAYAVAPGVVDTAMQQTIRSTSSELFPAVEKFHELQERGQFNTPAFVARQLLALAFDPERRPPEVVCRLPDEWDA